MNQTILDSTLDANDYLKYRMRSHSAPAWVAPNWISNQLRMEEYNFESDFYPTYDNNQTDENSQTDDMPKEITCINILSYTIVCFIILSSLCALYLIMTEVIKNPNFNIFLASWIFGVTLSMTFLTSIFVSDINDEISSILECFTNQPVNHGKKNI
jgi:hypothetical protein